MAGIHGLQDGQKHVYICHTYYHVYIACLKECALPRGERGRADLLLSRLSNDFEELGQRAAACGLFHKVLDYEEKEEQFFPQLARYHRDRGSLVKNLFARMKFTRLLGRLEEPYVPVDLKAYRDVYVFCDSDPVGYYLNYKKIPYHALEDGLDCIRYYDTARYDNRGHFRLKALLASWNLIFIQNGYSKYCIDMEVNDCSVLPYPCRKYKEVPRETLTTGLSEEDKELLVRLFLQDRDRLLSLITQGENHENKVLVLSEPLCDLDTRRQIFTDIIDTYGKGAQVWIKPHPRDVLDYAALFPQHVVLDGKFPMEILNYVPGLSFRKVVTVFTVPSAICFAEEKIFLGEDFMDRYEDPKVHRQNEQIG